ncbi:MAG: hypothetical protein JO057_22370 [Chloroflexi bacterium]|nr:hypothetical protein [Chloroflexota bacterium]
MAPLLFMRATDNPVPGVRDKQASAVVDGQPTRMVAEAPFHSGLVVIVRGRVHRSQSTSTHTSLTVRHACW